MRFFIDIDWIKPMLQDIRKSTRGTTAKVIIGVIVLSFALFGIESILVGGNSNSVAEVNGEPVTPIELQQVVDTQRRQIISMMGENLDPAMLDEQRLNSAALESIINRKLLMQAATRLGLTVSERELGVMISGMEQFQVDGRFAPDMYKGLLASAGYTPGTFKRALKDDLILSQLQAGLSGSDFATPAELALNARILAEQRDIRYLTIPLARFRDDAVVDESAIEAFYADNQSMFMTPESVELNYVELSLDDFREPVAEAAIEEEYRIEAQSYQYQDENRVSHILLEQRSGESDEALAERVARVQAELAAGRDFAEVAAELSDDIGSAGSGGDLGFTAGDAFPDEMEEAIAALEVDAVSAPVKTEAGIHILKVTERREAGAPSLAQLRPELEQRVQERQAKLALLSTVEKLRDLAFTADSLARPAEELGLEIKRSEPLLRDQPTGPLSNPQVLRAAFSEDVLERGHNSEVLELPDNRFVAVHLHRYNPAAVQELEAVREDIAAAIIEQRAREELAAAAEQAMEAIGSGEGVEALATRLGYEWQVELGARRDSRMVPRAVLQRAFALAAPATEPVVDYVVEPGGDARVVQLLRVTPGDLARLSREEQRGLAQRISEEYGAIVQVEHQQGLLADADITVF
ncbi:peptidylprolyl isomerase [Kineobactrum sediminis]|uniref:Periplasmic chaperone PpiD n=1 Tax=Kineobactrum sediminis TaxID=1905677 RepID=A0A2N5Y161_9GAMM|nr:SurA N-terminal domain-containing protein [Kineobactrum sediminis]PLW82125.1 peptidylprolyl isomerase [Kineobactrum sediminis]